MFFFFFSSRRRHTRYWRDWSSDVCSSDLVALLEKLRVLEALFACDLPLQIIPAVMQGNLPEALEMVEALDRYPLTAVLVLPPYFFKPASPQGLRRFFEPVLETTSHPLILYHIPKYA